MTRRLLVGKVRVLSDGIAEDGGVDDQVLTRYTRSLIVMVSRGGG